MLGHIIAFLLGTIFGPILVVFILYILRDVTPPILFTPSDWD